jgi:valyl-tRNA synthetase
LHTTQLLSHCLDISLRLLHPITPFVTEELWGHLRRALLASPLAGLVKEWPKALIIAPWPEQRQSQGWEEARLADFALVQDTVRAIRNLRAEKKVSPAKRIPATIAGGAVTTLVNEQAEVIAALAGVDRSRLEIHATLPAKPENSFALVVGPLEIYIPLSGMLDLDEERNRIQKELDEIRAQIDRLETLLGSDFASKAPARVVEKERQRLEEFQQTAAKLKAQLEP